MTRRRAIVIGAGMGGLATANILAKAGWRVSVYEQHAQAGGRAGILRRGGFTFDTGPSWYLMPEVFEHYFELLGKNVHKYLRLQRLDPAYKVFFQARDAVTIHADDSSNAAQFEAIEPGAGKRLDAYLNEAEYTYKMAVMHFLYNPFTSFRSFMRPDIVGGAPRLITQLVQPINTYVKKYVVTQELQQILEYPMVFLGTSPFKAPALYSLMSHMDFRQGVYYPMGGLYEIIKAMHTIGEEFGVDYHFNAPVTAILTKNYKAYGIRLEDGTEFTADIIISDADLHYTETQLVPEADRSYPEAYWQKREAGPSALLVYMGIRGALPELEHHNLFFVRDWRGNFEAIFDTKIPPKQASLYVCKPSATDGSVAPAGHENLFMLVPLPADETIGGDKAQQLVDQYLTQLETMSGIADLRKRIVTKELFTPADFASKYHAWNGTALGMSHLLRQSAFFRPANRSKKLANLYYAGANSQPGIGLPMCLIGAELIYKRLSNDSSAGPLASLETK